MTKQLKHIMLVEDEVDIQEVSRITLESLGNFIVSVCSNGQEALDQAPQIMPDLILLDVMMPHMGGLTTLKLLRENPQLKNIPVIFMTAKVQANEIQHYLECGALGTIKKPFDPMKLVTEINQIWDAQ